MIRRGFVARGPLYTHWRAAGSGPPLVMLHASPRCSASLVPLMGELSNRFCCIALDTPGYGASDPLSGRFSSITDFARATLEAVSGLGIETFHLYGTHTGAAIAIEATTLEPSRVESLLIDGAAAFNKSEQTDLLRNYLTPYPSEWDGSHLMRIWSRVCDQSEFFPFYDRSETARLNGPKSSLADLLDIYLSFLEAGDHYRDAYAAAITYDAASTLTSLETPARVHFKRGDVLSLHAARFAPSDSVEIERRPLDEEEWLEATQDWLEELSGDDTLSSRALPDDDQRKFVDTSLGSSYCVSGLGHGVNPRPIDPPALVCGPFGPPRNASDAGWFVDAPASLFLSPDRDTGYQTWREEISASLSSPWIGDPQGLLNRGIEADKITIDSDVSFLFSLWFRVRAAVGLMNMDELSGETTDIESAVLKSVSASYLQYMYRLLRHD